MSPSARSTRAAKRSSFPIPGTHAAERVRAAAEAAHALPFPFTLTARAENFIVGRPDLADTIARLGLSALGVKRVSVGSALSRAALGAFLRAAREMRTRGSFAFAEEAVSYREISAMFG